MPVNIFMIARIAMLYLSQRPVTVVCFVLMVQLNAHRFSKGKSAVHRLKIEII